MKILHFTFRGEFYQVNEYGHIKSNGSESFSPTWIFLGGSKHHWNTSITVPLNMAFESPEKLEGCLGWDKDHGTTRQWAGQYVGNLPRIRNVYVRIIV